MSEKVETISVKRLSIVTSLILILLLFVASPVYAWLNTGKVLLAYAPVSTVSSLFIGAGHNEDIKYLYFDGIDAKDQGERYKYYVFCISGEFAPYYKIQLAYTTNNQFTYDIFHATESNNPAGATVSYIAAEDGTTYYYTINGGAISGTYLNGQAVGGEYIADNTYHSDTYGSYNSVNKYAEPIYWQTSGLITGNVYDKFTHYYILRVYLGNKIDNDKETDVICIAAKTQSGSGS